MSFNALIGALPAGGIAAADRLTAAIVGLYFPSKKQETSRSRRCLARGHAKNVQRKRNERRQRRRSGGNMSSLPKPTRSQHQSKRTVRRDLRVEPIIANSCYENTIEGIDALAQVNAYAALAVLASRLHKRPEGLYAFKALARVNPRRAKSVLPTILRGTRKARTLSSLVRCAAEALPDCVKVMIEVVQSRTARNLSLGLASELLKLDLSEEHRKQLVFVVSELSSSSKIRRSARAKALTLLAETDRSASLEVALATLSRGEGRRLDKHAEDVILGIGTHAFRPLLQTLLSSESSGEKKRLCRTLLRLSRSMCLNASSTLNTLLDGSTDNVGFVRQIARLRVGLVGRRKSLSSRHGTRRCNHILALARKFVGTDSAEPKLLAIIQSYVADDDMYPLQQALVLAALAA